MEDSRSKDVYAMAHERVNSTLASQDFWTLDPAKANAIDGIGRMPAKGFCDDCSDEQVEAAVDHMLLLLEKQ